MQVFGTNNEAQAAFALLVDVLQEYDASNSRSIPRLRDLWDSRRAAELYPPPDSQYSGGGAGGPSGGGAGGPSPARERYSAYAGSSDSRYEPYPPRNTGPSSRVHYNPSGPGPTGHPGTGMGGEEITVQAPMVVMPGAVQVPNIPGGMPTVLIQQADGTLVQVRAVDWLCAQKLTAWQLHAFRGRGQLNTMTHSRNWFEAAC